MGKFKTLLVWFILIGNIFTADSYDNGLYDTPFNLTHYRNYWSGHALMAATYKNNVLVNVTPIQEIDGFDMYDKPVYNNQESLERERFLFNADSTRLLYLVDSPNGKGENRRHLFYISLKYHRVLYHKTFTVLNNTYSKPAAPFGKQQVTGYQPSYLPPTRPGDKPRPNPLWQPNFKMMQGREMLTVEYPGNAACWVDGNTFLYGAEDGLYRIETEDNIKQFKITDDAVYSNFVCVDETVYNQNKTGIWRYTLNSPERGKFKKIRYSHNMKSVDGVIFFVDDYKLLKFAPGMKKPVKMKKKIRMPVLDYWLLNGNELLVKSGLIRKIGSVYQYHYYNYQTDGLILIDEYRGEFTKAGLSQDKKIFYIIRNEINLTSKTSYTSFNTETKTIFIPE